MTYDEQHAATLAGWSQTVYKAFSKFSYRLLRLMLPMGFLACSALCQSTPPPIAATPASIVQHSTKAINYRRAGSTLKITFQGTALLPAASGEAEVKNKGSRVEISAKFSNLDEATKFGLEYLTYVLWAVSPQGRAENLGELGLKSGNGEVKAITDMQTFGMIVTAEPYFAVTQPGDTVVLENAVADGGETIEARYELLARGVYSSSNTKIESAIFGIDRKTPLELFEARNAVRIARNASAEKYAAASMSKAAQLLQNAENTYGSKRDRKTVEAAARDAVQTAEEARVIAVKAKQEEEAQARVTAEKRAAEEREAKARADAADEARRRKEADDARAQADQARAQAVAAQADAERLKLEAQKAAADAAQAKDEAEKARAAAQADQQAALEQKQAALADAEKAHQAAARAESEKADLRAQLLNQSSTLKPGAREKLAKISGIVLAHPGLTLQIEGHTDSVGSDDFNQQLSERRADSVRDFLAEQGVQTSSMTAHGFGKTQPVASNDTGEGRQRNRRVELVVNGDAIGKSASAVAASTP